jgi:hypothetical protein
MNHKGNFMKHWMTTCAMALLLLGSMALAASGSVFAAGGHATAGEPNVKRSDYMRAQTACFEGRGYSVK